MRHFFVFSLFSSVFFSFHFSFVRFIISLEKKTIRKKNDSFCFSMFDCYLSICFEYFCSNVAMKVRRVCHMTIAFVRWRLPHSCILFALIPNHMTDRMVGNVFLVFRICSTWEDDYTLRRMNQLNSNSKQQCVWNENERNDWKEIKNAAPKRKNWIFQSDFLRWCDWNICILFLLLLLMVDFKQCEKFFSGSIVDLLFA